MNGSIKFLAVTFLVVLLNNFVGAAEAVERSEWGKVFAQNKVAGTIYISDQRPGGGDFVYNLQRAQQRFSPASTFKIAHALFALDAGIIKNEFDVVKWDGVKRSIGIDEYDAIWNSDQTLQTSMRYSVVWFYQRLAKKLGLKREREYLKSIHYGNQEVGKDVEHFWLNGALQISAIEQVDFLNNLYRNGLPFLESHQRLVKDVLIAEAGSDYKVRSKTGWATPLHQDPVGWYVGWVERNNGAVFFATNIVMADGAKDLSKRKSITYAILKDIKALP